jgi:anaphase-promoting complex subunit 4
MPDAIRDWPTLVSDPLLASICPPGHKLASDRIVSDDPDVTNRDSLLVVVDNDGNLWCYQDGAFPLGRVLVGKSMIARSLYKVTLSPSILRLNVAKAANSDVTTICAVQVDLPLLRQRFCRELSQLSSAARDLTWYAMRVVKEMKTIWFGTEMNSGAREWGPRWLRSLEARQKEQYGRMLQTFVQVENLD